MQITRTSMISGVTRTLDLPVSADQIRSHMAGALIQDAFPNLMRWQREFILTGITDEEWQAAFPPEDEIELGRRGGLLMALQTFPEARPPPA